MKKLIATIITFGMTFCLVACGNTNTQSSTSLESFGQESASSQTADSSQSQVPESSAPTESSATDSIEAETAKTLVVYFSHSGNTKTVATVIQKNVEADIFEIKTINDYPSAYDDVLDVAQKEKSDNARPELNATVDKIEDYDVVFIGYPNWWGDMPMALYTFLDTYDLTGKTVIPFCTHGGSGFSDTVNSIKTAEADAIILEGLAIRNSDAVDADSEVADWLSGIGLWD